MNKGKGLVYDKHGIYGEVNVVYGSMVSGMSLPVRESTYVQYVDRGVKRGEKLTC